MSRKAPLPELTLLPLDDGPAGLAPRGDEAVRVTPAAEEVSAVTLMQGEDSGGFALMNYGRLIELLNGESRLGEQFLLDNPFEVKRLLEEKGLISAPDAALERRKLRKRDSVVLYRGDDDARLPFIRRRPYKKALLLVKFMTLAFSPLTQEEMHRIGTYIREWAPHPLYSRHLDGMLRWYDSRRRLLDRRTLSAYNEITTPEERQRIAARLLEVASARGFSLSPKSVEKLDRLMQLAGYEPGSVHSLLHRAKAAPMRLLPAHGLSPLATARAVADVEEETGHTRQLLAQVFETESAPAPSVVASQTIPAWARRLQDHEEWSLDEVAALCAPQSPATALEELNDLAMEKVGDTVADVEGDSVYVATEYLQALLSDE